MNFSVKSPTYFKEKSQKSIKLPGSVELPKLLMKSMSQTTVNKKVDDKRLKIMEKLGLGKKLDKNLNLKGKISKEDNNRSTIKINNFNLGKKLGNGRFGNVYMA